MSYLKLIAYLSIVTHGITNHKQGFPFPKIFYNIIIIIIIIIIKCSYVVTRWQWLFHM